MKFSIRALILAVLLALPGAVHAKRVGILVFDGMLTGDVTAPAEALGMAIKLAKSTDWTVELISAHDRPSVTTHEGLRLLVDQHILNAPDVDVLIVPGSYDNDAVLALPGVADYLKRQTGKAERVASNCAGAFLVASTGAYDGHRVTTYATGAEALKTQFPKVNALEGHRVVVDGRIISSNGGVVSYEAAVVLVAQLFDAALAKQVFVALQMDQTMPWSQIEAHLGGTPAKPQPKQKAQPTSAPTK